MLELTARVLVLPQYQIPGLSQSLNAEQPCTLPEGKLRLYMRITMIRITPGPRANLPVLPNSVGSGPPYCCTDTGELIVGMGLNVPMAQVSSIHGRHAS
jgi:hypothetical protein